jgi:hypothetical protein
MLPFLAAAGALIAAGSAVANHIAAEKAAKENRLQAEIARRETVRDIGLMQQQEQERSTLTLFEAERRARKNRSLAAVAAGESGLAGASVEMLLGDIERELGEFKTSETRNTEWQLEQLQREKVSAGTVAQNRIASFPSPNVFATGLQIAAVGIDYATSRVRPKV